jgi:phytoene dehydrogenase-like protein
VKVPLLVIGGGLSGLAAAIRAARFSPDVLLVEKHFRLGGLNSYFFRNGILLETGLHAITNYAEPGEKRAPLNRLLRQLKLHRDQFSFCQQRQSEVLFLGSGRLRFANDPQLLNSEIERQFPGSIDGFTELLGFLNHFDPFVVRPFVSTRDFLKNRLRDPLLAEMLLCPLLYYGSSHADDIDLSQFAIMFRAIYQEGMFRPSGTIKDLLDLLLNHYLFLGGTVRTGCGVKKIIVHGNRVAGVVFENGEELACDYILSTIGHRETRHLLGEVPSSESSERLGFVENIYLVNPQEPSALPVDRTIIFYNNGDRLHYRRPELPVDLSSGVICFPGNFDNLPAREHIEVRSTHLANYHLWEKISSDANAYQAEKRRYAARSSAELEKIVGHFQSNIVYENSFTPVTVKRYTAKSEGAIYGSPTKVKDGDLGFANLYLAGTDQGFLGIVGAMLSGISIVNRQILPKI